MIDSCLSRLEIDQSSIKPEEAVDVSTVNIPVEFEIKVESEPVKLIQVEEENEKNDQKCRVEIVHDLSPIYGILVQQASNLHTKAMRAIEKHESTRMKLIHVIQKVAESLSIRKEVELPSRISVTELNMLIADASLSINVQAIHDYRDKVRIALSTEVDDLNSLDTVNQPCDLEKDVGKLFKIITNIKNCIYHLDSMMVKIEQSFWRLNNIYDQNDPSNWIEIIDKMMDLVLLVKVEELYTIDCSMQVLMPVRRHSYILDLQEVKILAQTAQNLILETQSQFMNVVNLLGEEEVEIFESYIDIKKDNKQLISKIDLWDKLQKSSLL